MIRIIRYKGQGGPYRFAECYCRISGPEKKIPRFLAPFCGSVPPVTAQDSCDMRDRLLRYFALAA